MGKKVKSIVAPVAASLILGPAGLGLTSASLGAAIGSGIGTFADTGKIGSSLLSAGGSYLGSNIGSSLLGNSLGTAGTALGLSTADALPWGAANTSLGSSLGQFIGSGAANSIAGAPLSAVLGSSIGSGLGESLGAGNAKADSMPQLPPAPAGPAPFKPMQEDAKDTPPSISGLGQLTPMQQSTNIANQGVYGGGNGPQEQEYFLNLLNRRLVDPSGQTADMSGINPIEQSYLQRLGLGGYGNTTSLLEAISKYGNRNQVPA